MKFEKFVEKSMKSVTFETKIETKYLKDLLIESSEIIIESKNAIETEEERLQRKMEIESKNYKNSRIFPPKYYNEKNDDTPFKHFCDGCEEVFETKVLYPSSTWCPHCAKG